MEINLNELLQKNERSNNVILFRTSFFDITSDIKAALMLAQLVYWNSPAEGQKTGNKLKVAKKDFGGCVAKSANDWYEETRLTEDEVTRATEILEKLNLVEVRIHRFNNIPQRHYKLNINELLRQHKIVTANEFESKKYRKAVKERLRSTKKTSRKVIEEENSLTENQSSARPKNREPYSPENSSSVSPNSREPLTENTEHRLPKITTYGYENKSINSEELASIKNFPNSSETENLAQEDSFERNGVQENIVKESIGGGTSASSSHNDLKEKSPIQQPDWSLKTLSESGANLSSSFKKSSLDSDVILAEPVFEDSPKTEETSPTSDYPRFFTRDANTIADYSYGKEVQTLASNELNKNVPLRTKGFTSLEKIAFRNDVKKVADTIKELVNSRKTSRSEIKQAVFEAVDKGVIAKKAASIVFETWENAFDSVYGQTEDKVTTEPLPVQNESAIVANPSPQIKLYEKSLKIRNSFNTLNSIEKELIGIFERETGDIANEKEFFEAKAGAKCCCELISDGHLKVEDVPQILMWIATYKKGTKVSLKSVSEHYKTYYMQQKAPKPYLSSDERSLEMLKNRDYKKIIADAKRIYDSFG